MQTVVVATHNAHKVGEIRAILKRPDWQLVSLDEAGILESCVEDANSFTGNALLKARFAHQRSGLAALADDSGLVVDALGGAPGIYSARYAGEDANDTQNLQKLLTEMADVPVALRSARFVCAVAFVDAEGREQLASGTLEGRIALEPSGQGGFGYDPVFIPCESGKSESAGASRTLAEYSAEQKNALSHRYRALTALCAALDDAPGALPTTPTGSVHIAAFDLDGTLLDASSPVRLVLRLTKDRIMSARASMRVAAWGVHYKMGSELDQSLPRNYVFRSFKQVSASDADAIMHNLYHEELRRFLRPQALAELERHQSQGTKVLITSASFEPIVREVARDLGVDGFIATQMEVKDGCYTGKTVGEPPEGEQKMLQFRQFADEHYGVGNWVLDWAYGDHFSDVPLMELAAHPVAVDPDRRLERIARARKWPIQEWKT